MPRKINLIFFPAFIIFISFCFIFIDFSFAQNPPPPPESATAAAEQRRMQEKSIEEMVPKREAPKIEIEKPAAPEQQQIPPELLKEFYVSTVQIKGCTVFKLEEIQNLFLPYREDDYYHIKVRAPKSEKIKSKPKPSKVSLKLRPYLKDSKQNPDGSIVFVYNRMLSFIDLQDIAKKITNLYQGKGYVTSQAYIPPQEPGEGKITIGVFEGRFGIVEADKGVFFKKRLIEEKFKPRKGEIFNYNKLTKDLGDLNKTSDKVVKAVLVASKEPGYSDIRLTLQEKKPYHIKAEIDNTGTKTTGIQKYSGSIIHNNITRHEDIFSYKYSQSDHNNSLSHTISYSLPMNNYKDTLSYSGSYSRTRLTGQSSEALETGGDSYTVSLSYNHRFFATPKFELTGKVGFNAKRSTTEMLSAKLYKDSLREINSGFTLSEFDGWGSTSFRNETTFGIPGFMGASQTINTAWTTRSRAGAKFMKYNTGLTRFNRLPFSSSFLFNMDVQLTPDRLTSLEVFSLGGTYSVRGFPESEYSGDYGGKLSFELRTPFFILPQKWLTPFKINRNQAFTLITFVDAGRAYIKSPAATDYNNKTLCGAGVGLRVNLFNNNFSARADFAWPFIARSSDKLDNRLHYGVSWQF